MREISRDQLLAELRALRPEFERRGVAHMAVFGSRARGDNRPDSDVDLVIDVQQGRPFSLISLSQVGRLVESETGIVAQIVTRRGIEDPRFVHAVAKEEVGVF